MNKEQLMALIALWGVVETQKLISQLAIHKRFLKDNFFKKSKGVFADNLNIPIKRGDVTILEAIPSGANRQETSKSTLNQITLTLKRFALQDKISVANMRHLLSFDDKLRTEAFSSLVGESASKMKNDIEATKEFLRWGALFGKTTDGSGNVLYECKSDEKPLELNSSTNPEEVFEKFEDRLNDEFGTVPDYMMLASRSLYNNIWKFAVDNKLSVGQNIKKEKIDGVTCINWEGRIIRPVSVKGKDKDGKDTDLFETNKGILLPIGTDNYVEYHTTAEHMEAQNGMPKEYFAKISDALDGSGVEVLAESVCIAINTRPYAISEVVYK